MQVDDWHDTQAYAFACQLAADAASPPRWSIAFNPGPQPAHFRFPHGPWRIAIDSSVARQRADASDMTHGIEGMPEDMFEIPARSVVLLRSARLRHTTHSQEIHR